MSIQHKSNFLKVIALSTIFALLVPVIALATTYVGNKNSYKFHYQGCRAERKMKEYNRIYFNNRQEAINYGMTPCGICKP